MRERRPLTESAFRAALRRLWPGVDWDTHGSGSWLFADATAGILTVSITHRGWGTNAAFTRCVSVLDAQQETHPGYTLRRVVAAVQKDYDRLCRNASAGLVGAWRTGDDRRIRLAPTPETATGTAPGRAHTGRHRVRAARR